MDIPHYLVVALAYWKGVLIPKFWTGWGGDLTTLAAEINEKRTLENVSIDNMQPVANKMMGSDNYSFPREDILADVDGITLAEKLKNSNIPLSKILNDYHYEEAQNRFKKFISRFSSESIEELSVNLYAPTTGILEKSGITLPSGETIGGLRPSFGKNATEDDYIMSSRAVATYLINNL